MAINKSALIISATFPYPVDSGKRVVLSGFIDYFTQPDGVKRLDYVLIGEAPQACEGRSGLNVTVFPAPTFLRKLFNLFWHSVICRRKSFQESMIYSPRIRKRVCRLIESVSPTLVIADTVRAGQFL